MPTTKSVLRMASRSIRSMELVPQLLVIFQLNFALRLVRMFV